MSSKHRVFLRKKELLEQNDFDYPLYINESSQCGLILLFLFRSDADEWTRNYKMVNSSYDSQWRLYLAWEITSCECKEYLCVAWLPMVTNKRVQNGAPRPAREDPLCTNENGADTPPMAAHFQSHWRRAM